MHTRPASPADFSAITDICLAAFWNDELYAFANPYRIQYPHDFRNSFLRRIQLRFWTPGHVIFVAETDDADAERGDGSKQVVGFALWILEKDAGKTVLENAPGNTWKGALERELCRIRDTYVNFFGMDRSLKRENLALWAASQGDRLESSAAENAKFSAGAGYYKLQNLCVDPSWQRKGVGRFLMQWGLDRAREEDVPVVLTSSPMGSGLYLRQGFRIVGEIKVDGWLKSGGGDVGEVGKGKRENMVGEEARVVDVGVPAEGKGKEEVEDDDRYVVPIFLWEPKHEKNDNGGKA